MKHAIKIGSVHEVVALADVPVADGYTVHAGDCHDLVDHYDAFERLRRTIAPWVSVYVAPKIHRGDMWIYGVHIGDAKAIIIGSRQARETYSTLLHELFHAVYDELEDSDRRILDNHAETHGVLFGTQYQDDVEERLATMFEDFGRLLLMGLPDIAWSKPHGQRTFLDVFADIWSGAAAKAKADREKASLAKQKTGISLFARMLAA